jgi:DNA-directed RNA polymerase subunit RPC12/RpoP
MAIPNWICLDCKNEFRPVNEKGEFSFNCPNCSSPKTIVNRRSSVSIEPQPHVNTKFPEDK